MKEAFTNIAKIIGAILLIVLALIIFMIITIPALIWSIWYNIKEEDRKIRHILNSIKVYFTQIAGSFDQLGCAVFGGFLKWLFIDNSKEYYPFGNKDETISEVLGWNDRMDSLNIRGLLMVKLLDKLEKNHCEIAMNTGIELAIRKVKQDKQLLQ